MMHNLAANILKLKKEFQNDYDGKSHIQEVIPKSESEMFPIKESKLTLLHEFAKKNPIYYNSYDKIISGTDCIVYEGDINRYWLGSITQDSSHAPFWPTWIISAYVIASYCKEFGFNEIVDVGSGDGRIAYCAKMAGMKSTSIEIDSELVKLQDMLSDILDFTPYCSDASIFEYSSLNLKCPAFVIGGIAQMGGSELATAVLERIDSDPKYDKNGWVFTGTYSQKYGCDPKNNAGWGTLIMKNNLRVMQTVTLPTTWTFRESVETPYVFAISD